jgi:hypothetical protein
MRIRGIVQSLSKKSGYEPQKVIKMISSIINSTGCSIEQAKELLHSIFGLMKDVESKNESFVVKGRFKGIVSDTWGLFVLIINLREGSLEKLEAIVSRNGWLSLYDVSANWECIERYITRIRHGRGRFSRNLTEKLYSHLHSIFESNEKYSLLQAFSQYLNGFCGNNFEGRLRDVIAKAIGDESVELKRIVVSNTYSKGDMEKCVNL